MAKNPYSFAFKKVRSEINLSSQNWTCSGKRKRMVIPINDGSRRIQLMKTCSYLWYSRLRQLYSWNFVTNFGRSAYFADTCGTFCFHWCFVFILSPKRNNTAFDV